MKKLLDGSQPVSLSINENAYLVDNAEITMESAEGTVPGTYQVLTRSVSPSPTLTQNHWVSSPFKIPKHKSFKL